MPKENINMDKPGAKFAFIGMVLIFKVRDFFLPRKKVLQEAGLKPGFRVLDYGCGPGGYINATAELVGKSGKIYALDINPMAIRKVKDIALKKNLSNIETILSDCTTGLPVQSIDTVLCYDVFHGLKEPESILKELHRVLKTNSILSFSDHHLKEDEIISRVTKSGLFKLSAKGKKTYRFQKQE